MRPRRGDAPRRAGQAWDGVSAPGGISADPRPYRSTFDRLGDVFGRRPSAVVTAILLIASLAVIPFHPISSALTLRMVELDDAVRNLGGGAFCLTEEARDLVLRQAVLLWVLGAWAKLGLLYGAWGSVRRFARYHFVSQLAYLPLLPLFDLWSTTFDGVLLGFAYTYLLVAGGASASVSVVITGVGVLRGLTRPR